ncbi:MAG: phosphotransferase [Acidimicrobiales bacterium]
MSRQSELGAEAAASMLSEVTGENFRLVGQLGGGETGAHQFIGPDGRPIVVKWDATSDGRTFRGEAVALSERLRRQAGWPVPIESVVDADQVRFIIQEFMPGTPPTTIDHRLVDQLLDLHSRRLGLAELHDPIHWPMNLITTLVVGGEEYCRHESFRGYDERTRSLIKRIEAFGASLGAGDFVGSDVVHWDLHPGNLLVDAGGLSAVVDTDFAIVGDAGFDLVMLALTSLSLTCDPGVRPRLFAEAFDQLDEVRAQAYLGHLFVRLIDWPIRRNSPVEVDCWLARADELLTI